jgi:hypothetical protein
MPRLINIRYPELTTTTKYAPEVRERFPTQGMLNEKKKQNKHYRNMNIERKHEKEHRERMAQRYTLMKNQSETGPKERKESNTPFGNVTEPSNKPGEIKGFPVMRMRGGYNHNKSLKKSHKKSLKKTHKRSHKNRKH